MNREVERRAFDADEFRVEGEAEGRTIVGHAALFNTLSSDLGGFREKIATGAFSNAEENDVRALFNHDPNLILGRNKAGTLVLDEDERGLRVRISPPDTQFANDLLKSIERGDVTQMSFAFRVKEDDWEKGKGDDPSIRTLRKVELFDVSPVTYPAYKQTEVGVRSMSDIAEEGKQRLIVVNKETVVSYSHYDNVQLQAESE
jgi:uncharacterized protein